MKDNRTRPSIDGFSLKRRVSDTGFKQSTGLQPVKAAQGLRSSAHRPHVTVSQTPEILPRPEVDRSSGLSRADIDESLRAVDEAPTKKPRKKRRLLGLKMAGWLIFLIVLASGGYFAFKFIATSGRVFSGSVFDLLGGGAKLQKDASGRTNILVFGTSEDDPGHDGADLTDSILVVSLDEEKKTVGMVSMPRDMWVKYDTTCWVGDSGKINAAYLCAAGQSKDEIKGANALRAKVGEIFGLDVQYFVKVNYTVVRELTTALGGVTVTIASDNPRGIYDSGMGNLLKLPNGPATLKGEQALAFVRARGEGYGSYGFNNNFSREENQQKMLVAIRDKALSVGTLTNPVAVNSLLDALGNNIRTNFSAGEIKTLAVVAKDIPETSIVQISLIDEKKPVVTTGTYNAQSIVKPIAGLSNYTKIQEYIQAKLSGAATVEFEDATVVVLNGSGKVGAAGLKQTALTQAGLVNITVGDTAYRPKVAVEWYDLSGGAAPTTRAKLVESLGVQPTGTKLPVGVQATSDFVILLGNGTN